MKYRCRSERTRRKNSATTSREAVPSIEFSTESRPSAKRQSGRIHAERVTGRAPDPYSEIAARCPQSADAPRHEAAATCAIRWCATRTRLGMLHMSATRHNGVTGTDRLASKSLRDIQDATRQAVSLLRRRYTRISVAIWAITGQPARGTPNVSPSALDRSHVPTPYAHPRRQQKGTKAPEATSASKASQSIVHVRIPGRSAAQRDAARQRNARANLRYPCASGRSKCVDTLNAASACEGPQKNGHPTGDVRFRTAT